MGMEAGAGPMYDNVRSGNKVILDPKERLHDRLAKLLSLTKSGSEAEAQAAATRLQELLTEHNLSVADLERRGQAAPGVREDRHDLGKAAFGWKLDLAEGIASFYYCVPLVDRKAKTVAFVGRPDNVEGLQMLYAWIIEQVKDIARQARRDHFDQTGEHIDPLRWQVNFGEGAVWRLVERMEEMKARQVEDIPRNAEGDIVGLALHHATEASDYLEVKYGYRRDGKRTKREQESIERYQAREAEREELKARCEAAGDMEPYYKLHSWDRPDTPEEEEARRIRNEKYIADLRKKDARNARRRTGGGGREAAIDWDKEDQQSTAREAGRIGADKVNIQPFIGGQTGTDRKRVR